MSHGPNIHLPPPLVYVAAFTVGLLAGRFWPLPLGIGESLASPLGSVLVAAGLALAFWGMFTFARHRTAVFPNRPATTVVRDGPYRFSRNPMYLGLAVAYIGGAVLLDTVWPLVFLPIAVLAINAFIITREEQYLAREFGEEYTDFRKSVRRWI